MKRNSGAVLIVVGVVATLLFSGCASIQSTSVSEVNKGPGHRIRAEDTGHGFFMISLPDLDAVVRLKSQCEGRVTGIETTTWVRNWFLIVQHYHQESIGWCQPQ